MQKLLLGDSGKNWRFGIVERYYSSEYTVLPILQTGTEGMFAHALSSQFIFVFHGVLEIGFPDDPKVWYVCPLQRTAHKHTKPRLYSAFWSTDCLYICHDWSISHHRRTF